MNVSNQCFICSHTLLSHVVHGEKNWYCSHCREYFPASFHQRIYEMNMLRSETLIQTRQPSRRLLQSAAAA